MPERHVRDERLFSQSRVAEVACGGGWEGGELRAKPLQSKPICWEQLVESNVPQCAARTHDVRLSTGPHICGHPALLERLISRPLLTSSRRSSTP